MFFYTSRIFFSCFNFFRFLSFSRNSHIFQFFLELSIAFLPLIPSLFSRFYLFCIICYDFVAVFYSFKIFENYYYINYALLILIYINNQRRDLAVNIHKTEKKQKNEGGFKSTLKNASKFMKNVVWIL